MTTTKSLSLLLLAIATILAIATPTLAVDIQVFDSSTACDGAGFTFSGIGPNVCAAFNSGSVQIRDLSSCQTGTVYNGGGCTTSLSSANGPNVDCFIGGGFTGAAWFNNCRRRKLQAAAEAGTSECTSHAQPTGIHYTHSEGSWILPSADATLLLDLLRAVEDAEKAEWLKAQGAHFVRN